MLAEGILPRCIPWKRGTQSGPAQERDVLAEIERIIIEDGDNRQRMRLRIGMALWDCDRHTAAKKLDISWRTAYRVNPE